MAEAAEGAVRAGAEALKTFVLQSYRVGGQLTNGIASFLLHWTLEPGYLGARRGRFFDSEEGMRRSVVGALDREEITSLLDQLNALPGPEAEGESVAAQAATAGSAIHLPSDKANLSLDEFSVSRWRSGNALEASGEFIRHQMQPTAGGRWSSGLLEDLRLSTLVYIDTVSEGCIQGLRERGCGRRIKKRSNVAQHETHASGSPGGSLLQQAAFGQALSSVAATSVADSTGGTDGGVSTPSFGPAAPSSSAAAAAVNQSASLFSPSTNSSSSSSTIASDGTSTSSGASTAAQAQAQAQPSLVRRWLPQRLISSLLPSLPKDILIPPSSTIAMSAMARERSAAAALAAVHRQQHLQQVHSPLAIRAMAGGAAIPGSPLVFQSAGGTPVTGSPLFTALPPPSTSTAAPLPRDQFTPMSLPAQQQVRLASSASSGSSDNSSSSPFATPRGVMEAGGFSPPASTDLNSLPTPSGAISFSAGGAAMSAAGGGVPLLYPRISDVSTTCHIIGGVCGFPVETYASVTADGYVLTLIRIPRPESRRVVFFQHGLLDSASAWVSTGDLYSLAARAYASGCDVFLGNLRGSNDALGSNGIGANPADYGEELEAFSSAAAAAGQSLAEFSSAAAQKIGAAVVAAAAALTTEQKAEELSQAASQAIERATLKAKSAAAEVVDSAVKTSKVLLPEALHKRVTSMVDLASLAGSAIDRPPSRASVPEEPSTPGPKLRPVADGNADDDNAPKTVAAPAPRGTPGCNGRSSVPPSPAAPSSTANSTSGLMRASASWGASLSNALSAIVTSSGGGTRVRSGSTISTASASSSSLPALADPRTRSGTIDTATEAEGAGNDRASVADSEVDTIQRRDTASSFHSAVASVSSSSSVRRAASSSSLASASTGITSPLRGQLGRTTRLRFNSFSGADNEEAEGSPSVDTSAILASDTSASTVEPGSYNSFSTARSLATTGLSEPSSDGEPYRDGAGAAAVGSAEATQHGAPSPQAAATTTFFSTRQALAHVVGRSADGLPVHLTLHPRQAQYWSYDVFDHTLDVLSFIKTIRLIKTAEASLRRRLRGEDTSGPASEAKEGGAQQAAPSADDCSIIGIGHSMGCAILMNHILLSRALRRPHWITKLILLSPAGLHKHLPFGAKPLLKTIHRFGLLKAERPFPMRSSFLQRLGSKILQDLKGLQGTGDLLAVLGSLFFGGERAKFVFRYVSVTDYPIGGTSQRVIRHGIQAINCRDFQAYDYGRKENQERYGTPTPPSFREDYGLLFGVPIHIVAGGKDMLVPKQNIHETHALINLILGDSSSNASSSNNGSSARREGDSSSSSCTLFEFPSAGHLDLTLTTDDEIISHVLTEIDYAATTATTGSAGVPSFIGQQDQAAPPTYGGPDDILGLAAVARRRLQDYLGDAFPGGVTTNGTGGGVGTAGRWIPAREAAKRHRWIMGLTNAEVALEALDAEAAELGLVPPGGISGGRAAR